MVVHASFVARAHEHSHAIARCYCRMHFQDTAFVQAHADAQLGQLQDAIAGCNMLLQCALAGYCLYTSACRCTGRILQDARCCCNMQTLASAFVQVHADAQPEKRKIPDVTARRTARLLPLCKHMCRCTARLVAIWYFKMQAAAARRTARLLHVAHKQSFEAKHCSQGASLGQVC